MATGISFAVRIATTFRKKEGCWRLGLIKALRGHGQLKESVRGIRPSQSATAAFTRWVMLVEKKKSSVWILKLAVKSGARRTVGLFNRIRAMDHEELHRSWTDECIHLEPTVICHAWMLKAGSSNGAKTILQEFGGENIHWGLSESVLVDGDKVICTPGDRRATMVALDRNTGNVIWTAAVPTSPKASYASPIAVDVGGVRQYVNYTHGCVVGVRASDGRVMWGHRESSNGTANCSTPVFYDGSIFTASGYDTGGALFRLQSRNGQTVSQVAYSTREMKNHHGRMVVVNGYLYG